MYSPFNEIYLDSLECKYMYSPFNEIYLDSPECKIEGSRLQQAKIGESVKLQCKVC